MSRPWSRMKQTEEILLQVKYKRFFVAILYSYRTDTFFAIGTECNDTLAGRGWGRLWCRYSDTEEENQGKATVLRDLSSCWFFRSPLIWVSLQQQMPECTFRNARSTLWRSKRRTRQMPSPWRLQRRKSKQAPLSLIPHRPHLWLLASTEEDQVTVDDASTAETALVWKVLLVYYHRELPCHQWKRCTTEWATGEEIYEVESTFWTLTKLEDFLGRKMHMSMQTCTAPLPQLSRTTNQVSILSKLLRRVLG